MLYFLAEEIVEFQSGQRFDVLIGGAGFAGLALAIALRQGLGPRLTVDAAVSRQVEDMVERLRTYRSNGVLPKIVIVQTAPGYAGNPGHPGTGVVVATLCQ